MEPEKRRLTPYEIENWMEAQEGWREDAGMLVKTWEIKAYFKAVAFVTQIAWLAQMQNHHPDITLSWGRVVVRMISHDVGGLTIRDLTLAQAIENLPKDF